jgi:hypothetical protein
MRRLMLVGVLGLLLLGSSTPARALVAIAPGMVNPGLARGPQAEAVVVGRVVAMEDKDIKVQNSTYRIAVVQVADALKGTKEKMVRVGFIPMEQPANPNPKLRPTIGRFGNPQLSVGQDGLFFLAKGPDGKFYTVPQNWAFVPSDAANFKSEVETAKVALKIGANPAAALKSKEAPERLMAATMLIEKYRAPMLKAKLEPIDADESKLIMKALAEADWTSKNYAQTHPWQLFNRLGVTQQDGWTQPRGAIDVITKAAKEWVEKNADTYRIKKNVGGQPIGPGVRPLPINPPIQIQPIQPKLKIQIQPLPAPVPPQALPVQPGQAIPLQPQVLPAVQPRVLPAQPQQAVPVQPRS